MNSLVMRVVPLFLFLVSILLVLFPGFSGDMPKFLIAQIAFVAVLPFFVFKNSVSLSTLILFIAGLFLFWYSFFFFESPTFGIFYLISAVVFASGVKVNKEFIKFFSYVSFWLAGVSIALSFIEGADRVVFFGGDPNFTSFWLSMLILIFITFGFSGRHFFVLSLIFLILFTFSRAGLLFLLCMALYYTYKSFFRKKSQVSDGFLFVLLQIMSVVVSAFFLFIVFNDKLPDYTYRYGFEKFDPSSLIDISNFLRLKGTLFFLNPDYFDVLLFGAWSNEITAFDYGDKFIRPHNFLVGMVFEFGIFFTVAIFYSIYKKKYWPNRSFLLFLTIYGSILGFSYYYGFVVFLIIIFSKYFDFSSEVGFEKNSR